MKSNKIQAKIIRRKKILNILLLFLPTNCKLCILVSQNLDNYIHRYQKQLLILHRKKSTKKYKFLTKRAA